MSKKVILAPHLDDEIIGCFSILDEVDLICFFHNDYRVHHPHVYEDGRYLCCSEGSDVWSGWQDLRTRIISDEDTVYIPSGFDLHPLHKKINRAGKSLPGTKMFYSVEMNVPWLEEETNPPAKKAALVKLYPDEVETLSKNDKYFLFKSIKAYDDYIWASVRLRKEFFHRWIEAPEATRYLRNTHRHMLHIQVDVQQFQDNRDVEYHDLLDWVEGWWTTQGFDGHDPSKLSWSCEMVALHLKRDLEIDERFLDRAVRVHVYEDGENGCRIE